MKFKAMILAAALAVGGQAAQAAEAVSVNDLLKLVQQGQARDDQQTRERLARFNSVRADQEQMLAEARRELAALEADSVRKEQLFQSNETRLAESQERLTERMGSLKELFGVLQQVAGDTRSSFEGSVISAELPGRSEFLGELIKNAGSSSRMPSVEELERLWFEMQREMTYSGRVSSFQTDVVLPSGESARKNVVRIGSFNLISEGQFLNWDLESARVVQLDKQPGARYNDTAVALEAASAGQMTGFWIDPSRGQLLTIKGQSPAMSDRIEQGGVVGYIIMGLGAVGILLALVRMLMLTLESGRIRRQMAVDVPDQGNALGRVMAVYQSNRQADIETLELHLGEAIAAEIPRLTTGITWIKIISVVAPLLGLLGTVTGMIDVFETMSLFGTGDPKLMAGGISQALVTTVQGLVTAIPCVFLHTLTNNRSRALIMILEERATGILARQSEQHPSKAAA